MSGQTLRWEGDYVFGQYIKFIHVRDSPTGKTMIWQIVSTFYDGNVVLGYVKWLATWRTYALFPEPETVFEKTCLREIAQFCDDLTTQHRAKSRMTNSSPSGRDDRLKETER